MNEDVSPVSGLIIVAHPDDEILWAGGNMLLHPEIKWTVITLCRRSDPDRNPKFHRVLRELGAEGGMGDIDDGPEQNPLPGTEVEHTLCSLLPEKHFDRVFTHGPAGEYTRHRRHEETSRAVQKLWGSGIIRARELWLFAYEDGGRRYPPRVIESAHRVIRLADRIRREKLRLITEIYGFSDTSFEALAVSDSEAFWCFNSPQEMTEWTNQRS